jgi:hypothetical protein
VILRVQIYPLDCVSVISETLRRSETIYEFIISPINSPEISIDVEQYMMSLYKQYGRNTRDSML